MYQAEFIIPFWFETLVNTPSKHDVDPMLVQCLPTICDIKPALVQRLVCAGSCVQPSKNKKIVLRGVFWNVLKI